MAAPATPEGVLVVDKPGGLTSHDVVAVARRVLRERRIGHTGTLDPMATGVLPLAVGRATRLVRFLTSSHKTYEAGIRFGIVTDTGDITGQVVRESAERPTHEALLAALDSLRGPQMQVPPAYSAKKIEGRRAYELARKQEPVTLQPVPVTVSALELLGTSPGPRPDGCAVRLTVSAGFYVRSFAVDLGERLGCGACLDSLRRTGSGSFTLDDAVTLEALQASQPGEGAVHLVPLEQLLPEMPAGQLTDEGRRRLGHGQPLRAGDLRPMDGRPVPAPAPPPAAPPSGEYWVRLFDATGGLAGLAILNPDGSLRPRIVLT